MCYQKWEKIKKPKNYKLYYKHYYNNYYFLRKTSLADEVWENYFNIYHFFNKLNRLTGTEVILAWKSKGFSSESINNFIIAANSLYQNIKWYGDSKIILVFKGSWLKQDFVTFTSSNLVNLIIALKLDKKSRELNV